MTNKYQPFEKSHTLTLRSKLIFFRHSTFFRVITLSVIFLYALLLALKSHHDAPWFEAVDRFITVCFLCEIAFKLLTENKTLDFFKDPWNVFDFIIVSLSIIPIAFLSSIAIVRLLRVFRFLRLIGNNYNIRKILTALEGSVPAIANIVLLMGVVFYVYAIFGTQFFGDLESGLWENFSVSMLTLFRVLTFEGWADVMYEAMEVSSYAWIYFVSFIFINAFVMFNLFVAVIIDEISKIKSNNINDLLKSKPESDLELIQKELIKMNTKLAQLEAKVNKNDF